MEHLHTSVVLLFLFCSPWLSAGTTYLTHLETPCIGDCKQDGGEYKCKTIDEDGRSQTMYCSPQENMDYRGRQCRADSMCGKHGEDYFWCRINVLTWGYCGLVKNDKESIGSGEVTHVTSRPRNKRAPEVIDTVCDKNGRIITFYKEEANIIQTNKRLKTEAEDLINQWNNGKLVDQPRSNLIKSEILRIDMQGSFPRNNRRYYNLQIQINVQRPAGRSTTISQIIVSDEVSEEHVRRAFRESLDRSARVRVEVSEKYILLLK